MINKKSNTHRSEVHAYLHISQELEKKGWNRDCIYTQGECLKVPEIKKYLGQTKPENIVEISNNLYYAVEAKNERRKLDQALKEAREDYADKINKSSYIKCLFITGIAGNNEEGYIAKSQYYKDGKWESITENSIEVTSLLSDKQIENILRTQSPHIEDVEITEDEFLEAAENINEILHENSINKDYRARFISAILLGMSDGREVDVTQNADVLIENINARVRHILKNHDKFHFSNFIKIDEPSSPDNHIKVKEAIKRTYQELLNLNIRSAMNSGKDVLGKFYEVFLKYGNGAKDIGIVLTPRHITKFVAQVLDINHTDLILDPACGTGGFLVSAFDEVRRKTKNKNEFENFRLNGMYGIEEQDSIISLAIVNMIFRGDGKNNMIEGNCFRKWLSAKTDAETYRAEYLSEDKKDRIPPITKVMMNPPFALKKGDEKEYKFIEQALKQMSDEGLLFTVLPMSVLAEKSTKDWRKNVLLKNNRVLSVITFPDDLFYPVGVITVGLFLKKGVPHNLGKDKVYFARCMKDGFAKKKGVRKLNSKTRDMLEEIKEELKRFIKNPSFEVDNIPEFKKACLLDASDMNCELVPEAYLDNKIPSEEEIEKGVEEMIRNAAAFTIRFSNKLQILNPDNKKTNKDLANLSFKSERSNKAPHELKIVKIKDLFSVVRGEGSYLEKIDEGNTPIISTQFSDNGVCGFYDIEPTFQKGSITVGRIMCNPNVQLYDFATVPDDMFVLTPIKAMSKELLFYISSIITTATWRFNYSRKVTREKLENIGIPLPIKNNDIDYTYIEEIAKNSYGYSIL